MAGRTMRDAPRPLTVSKRGEPVDDNSQRERKREKPVYQETPWRLFGRASSSFRRLKPAERPDSQRCFHKSRSSTGEGAWPSSFGRETARGMRSMSNPFVRDPVVVRQLPESLVTNPRPITRVPIVPRHASGCLSRLHCRLTVRSRRTSALQLPGQRPARP